MVYKPPPSTSDVTSVQSVNRRMRPIFRLTSFSAHLITWKREGSHRGILVLSEYKTFGKRFKSEKLEPREGILSHQLPYIESWSIGRASLKNVT